jgi:predicted RNA binding protein YcfA (HicA-like mRNA interferase family)
VTYREIARRLQELGCFEVARRGAGSHRKWENPATGRATAIPDWGSKDLKIGTIRGAIRQLGINWEDFRNR